MFYLSNLVSDNTNRKVPNQHVVEVGSKRFFQSYESLCACIEYSAEQERWILTLSDKYNYSKTTSKWFWNFIRNYGTTTYCDLTKKELDKMIKSGEVKVVSEQELRRD